MTHLLFVLATAGAAAILAALSPRWLARLPEPVDESFPGEEAKPLYRHLAAKPRLSWWFALTAFLAAGSIAWSLESRAILGLWAYVVAVGVLLAYVDWHTRLLPTRIIAPSYAVVIGLLGMAALLSGDWARTGQALLAGVAVFGFFFVAWFIFPRGMGYGDVRLSGILGISLGWLGWSEVLVGMYASFVIGAVGGLLLSRLRIVDAKAFPFGPFLLIGTWCGAICGPAVASWIG